MSTGSEAHRRGARPIQTAIDRAIAFLARRQRPDGELPVCAGGLPDPAVFPTAVMAQALSCAPAARQVRDRALDFLQAEMDPRGLWRHWPSRHPHHTVIPPDLDDTACASAVLAQSGRGVPDNRRWLLGNRTSKGLFRTWVITRVETRHPIALYGFFRHTSARPFDVDAVVNANVLHYLGPGPHARPVVEHLAAVMRDGRERACDKWYENPFVVWYFFSRALHVVAPELGPLMAARITSVAPASPLEAALAACSLGYWQQPVTVEEILHRQLESGAWPAAALYHGGRLRRRDGSFAAPHPDTPHWGSEELTTAFCIEALSRGLSGPDGADSEHLHAAGPRPGADPQT
jgi:hypothetical protein